MDYFKLSFILGNETKYAIWCGNADDVVAMPDSILAENGQACTFSSQTEADEYARAIGVSLHIGEVATYDFNTVQMWIDGNVPEVQPGILLDTWNIMLDFAVGLPGLSAAFVELSNQHLPLHEKLTLLSVPAGILQRHGAPQNNLSRQDVALLRNVLAAGYELFVEGLRR